MVPAALWMLVPSLWTVFKALVLLVVLTPIYLKIYRIRSAKLLPGPPCHWFWGNAK